MLNTKFEAYKVSRELKRVGKEYEFKRPKKNGFGEPEDDEEFVSKFLGLYHEQNGYIKGSIDTQVSVGGTIHVRTEKKPMILCLYDDAKTLKIGDIVRFNSKTYKVTGVVNIQEWNIVSDISLEVVDDGIQA